MDDNLRIDTQKECSECGRFLFDNTMCNFCSNYQNIVVTPTLDIHAIYSLICKNTGLLHLDQVGIARKGPFYQKDTILLKSEISKKIYNRFPIIEYKDRKLVYKFYERWIKIICEFMEYNLPDEWSGYIFYNHIKTNVVPMENGKKIKCCCYSGTPTPFCHICKMKWMKVPDIIRITYYVDRKIDIRRKYRLTQYPIILTIMRSLIKKDGCLGILSHDIVIVILSHATKFKRDRLYRIHNKLKNILVMPS